MILNEKLTVFQLIHNGLKKLCQTSENY
jgi:hypothetical protein